jgi:hypothetical protein
MLQAASPGHCRLLTTLHAGSPAEVPAGNGALRSVRDSPEQQQASARAGAWLEREQRRLAVLAVAVVLLAVVWPSGSQGSARSGGSGTLQPWVRRIWSARSR